MFVGDRFALLKVLFSSSLEQWTTKQVGLFNRNPAQAWGGNQRDWSRLWSSTQVFRNFLFFWLRFLFDLGKYFMGLLLPELHSFYQKYFCNSKWSLLRSLAGFWGSRGIVQGRGDSKERPGEATSEKDWPCRKCTHLFLYPFIHSLSKHQLSTFFVPEA